MSSHIGDFLYPKRGLLSPLFLKSKYNNCDLSLSRNLIYVIIRPCLTD